MKKVNVKGKLSLKKETLSNLSKSNLSEIQGGKWWWTLPPMANCTAGCTDGCTSKWSFQTAINCSDGNCSGNCNDC